MASASSIMAFTSSIIASVKPIILHVFKIMAIGVYYTYDIVKVVNIKTTFIKIIFSNLHSFTKVTNKINIFLHNYKIFYNYRPFFTRFFTLNNYLKTVFKFMIIIFNTVINIMNNIITFINIIKIIKEWWV